LHLLMSACASLAAQNLKKAPIAEDYIANQKALDTALLPALSTDLKGYLSARFTLRDGDRPHLMKF
jgi:large subunit ribosomal protein L6e